jgi:diaminohydroxyphosphoribosylaminopyrimidine deaminase / 5-amino-6-(5-phosphoribosylamino)uracil reductase
VNKLMISSRSIRNNSPPPCFPKNLNPPEMAVAKPEPTMFMRQALTLAKRGYGNTSPNPLVGAVLVKGGKVIGKGFHKAAGQPHAEIEAVNDAKKKGESPKGADLYVTLEPCCTYGRTPPCTDSIIAAGIKRVFVAATDPNPAHKGEGLKILQNAGIRVAQGLLAEEAERLNESFNYWIARKRPFVIAKAGMSLDGKIATTTGESKWITSEKSRAIGMRLRQGADAILAGVSSIVADDPSLTIRPRRARPLPRFILDPTGRIPLTAGLLNDDLPTTVVMSERASRKRQDAIAKKASVLLLDESDAGLDLGGLLNQLGDHEITNLLIEGGGETHWTFFERGLLNRVVFFYAPKIIGGRNAPKAVAGPGFENNEQAPKLRDVEWSRAGEDLMMTALVTYKE